MMSKENNKQYCAIDHLTPPQKKQLWEGISKHQPALAELMLSDAIKEIKQTFGAVQMMDQAEINSFTKG